MNRSPLFMRIAVCSCVTAAVCNAQAQEPRNYLDAAKSGSIRERITNDLMKWDSITDHRTGSEGDNATADWLVEEIRNVGLNPHLDRFEFQRRVLQECSIDVGGIRIVGVPLFDGGVTGREPIRAKLGQPGEAGTIALTHYTARKGDEATKKLMADRNRPENLAIVAVAPENAIAPGIALLNAEAHGQPYGLPVLQVSGEHAKILDMALKSGQETAFWAHVELEESNATNVQVTIKGKQPELSPLVIMTPLSGWWTCVSERGGGITVWLECIRQFAAFPPARDVIFTANTGHELGHLGFDHFLHKNDSLVKDAHAWIHLGANFSACGSQLYVQASSDKHKEMMLAQLWAQGETDVTGLDVGNRPLGEAGAIFDGGGKFVSIVGTNPLFHHPHDRWPHAVDLQRTEELTRALLQTARQLAEK